MANSFCITNLRMEGATCKVRDVSLVDVPFTSHDLTVLRWVNEEPKDVSKTVNLPLYLNTTRSNLITVVPFEPAAGVKPDVFYRRAVAMMCSSLSGIVA